MTSGDFVKGVVSDVLNDLLKKTTGTTKRRRRRRDASGPLVLAADSPASHSLAAYRESPSLICFSISITAKNAIPTPTMSRPSIRGTGRVLSTVCSGSR